MSIESEQFEYFEYPLAWASTYRTGRGNLKYFAQYALMDLLLGLYGIQSITWLFISSVDGSTRQRMRDGVDWAPGSPRPSRTNHDETQKRRMKWKTMRTVMGPRFDTLQRAVVEAGFTGYKGEPDLFCYSDDGTWFFAEAKTPDDSFRDSQRKWFSIAETLPDSACPIFRCQVVPEGFPIVTARHTDKWLEMMAARQVPEAGLPAAQIATPRLFAGASRNRHAV